MKTRWYRSLPFIALYRECNVKIGEREIDDAYMERVPMAIALSNYRPRNVHSCTVRISRKQRSVIDSCVS